jgi:hypothetical protein
LKKLASSIQEEKGEGVPECFGLIYRVSRKMVGAAIQQRTARQERGGDRQCVAGRHGQAWARYGRYSMALQ